MDKKDIHQDAAKHGRTKDIMPSREYLTTILESITHPFYVIDVTNYHIKIANSAARKAARSNTATCYALTHRRDTPCEGEHACPLEEVKKTNSPIVLEHIHYDENKNPRTVEVHAHPVFDQKGNLAEMIEYTLDITERRRRLEKEVREEYTNKFSGAGEEKIVNLKKEVDVLLKELGREGKYGY